MPDQNLLTEVIILLAASVAVVFIFQRIGLGAVLGYLVAGGLIGPFGLELVTDTGTITVLGEFGVVFLLFIIGLELPFERLRVMRGPIFGLGLLQILLTTAMIFAVSTLLDMSIAEAVIVGAALSLSSTAVVVTLLSDQRKLSTRIGRNVFSVLLMQDLAVGPFLAVVVVVGSGEGPIIETVGLAFVKMIAAIVVILGIGRWLLIRLFVTIGSLRNPEIFAGFTLLVLLSAAGLTEIGGLSLAFGAFLAGMLLADTPFRHQVAAEIHPFRGLLLGLFFMGVGMGINTDLVAEHSGDIALLVTGLIGLKAVIMFTIVKVSGVPTVEAAETGLYLSQGGEFAFIILAAAFGSGLISGFVVQIVSVIVALSMLITPICVRLFGVGVVRWEIATAISVDDAQNDFEMLNGHIVIVGIGRVGRTIAGQLQEANQSYVGLDTNPHAIAAARLQGVRVYYGDATKPEVLNAIGLDRARAIVIAIDDPTKAIKMINVVKYIFPDLAVFARARDAEHARDLENAGAASTVPEVIPTAMQLVNLVLKN